MFRNIYINTDPASEYDIPDGMRITRHNCPRKRYGYFHDKDHLTKYDFREYLEATPGDRIICDVFWYDPYHLTEILRWLIIVTDHFEDGIVDGSEDVAQYERSFKQMISVMRQYQPESVLTISYSTEDPTTTQEIHHDFLQLECPYSHFNGCKLVIEKDNTDTLSREKMHVLCTAHNNWFIDGVNRIMKKYEQFLIVNGDNWKNFIKKLPARNLCKPPQSPQKPKLKASPIAIFSADSDSNKEYIWKKRLF